MSSTPNNFIRGSKRHTTQNDKTTSSPVENYKSTLPVNYPILNRNRICNRNATQENPTNTNNTTSSSRNYIRTSSPPSSFPVLTTHGQSFEYHSIRTWLLHKQPLITNRLNEFNTTWGTILTWHRGARGLQELDGLVDEAVGCLGAVQDMLRVFGGVLEDLYVRALKEEEEEMLEEREDEDEEGGIDWTYWSGRGREDGREAEVSGQGEGGKGKEEVVKTEDGASDKYGVYSEQGF